MAKGIFTSVRHKGEEEWNCLEGNVFQGCGVSAGKYYYPCVLGLRGFLIGLGVWGAFWGVLIL
jgi:hypothetical protein